MVSDKPVAAKAAAPNKTQLRIGRLTKAHGLKGALKIELYTDDPERRFVPGAVFSLQVPTGHAWHGKTLELIELRFYNSHAVGFFKDVPDRSAAEALVKAILWVEQDVAELPEEDDAWYDHQLVGLTVLRDGEKVGTVSQIDHFPAQDLLTVDTPGGDVLVPFVKAIVTAVDIKAGTLTVSPPPGLFEELADDELDPELATKSQSDAEAEAAHEANDADETPGEPEAGEESDAVDPSTAPDKQ
ncbi:MAG: ribosome maturation factor RimM [Glaciihabitans sp.]|nr:ribosome maturation factor RimM [Glaciihabitans sp.]